MHLLDIAEVARISGLSASALRYYEEKGLIASAGRRGLRRQFEPAVLDVLDAIGLARWAGFSLDEVRGWIAGDGTIRPDRESLAARAGDIEALAARLTALWRAATMRRPARSPPARKAATGAAEAWCGEAGRSRRGGIRSAAGP